MQNSNRNSPVIDAHSLDMALAAFQQKIDQLQTALNQQQKLATLGMVTAVIAHEFNNILTPMISYTKVALGEKADDELKHKALTKALAGSERLANISKSLLGFARDDASTKVTIRKAIDETLSCLSRDLSKDGITLVVDVPEELSVAMNAGQLQQVLMNLIVNARSAMLAQKNAAAAMAAGGLTAARAVNGAGRLPPSARMGIKRLTLRAVNLGPAGAGEHDMIQLRIEDTGPGIPADVLPRIFDPFYSTKSADGHEEHCARGGTGLGLTICRELITQAGGTIAVESTQNVGTAFTIELPAAK